MATPNLVSGATITPKNAMGNLGDTNRTTMVDVTAEYAAKINTILISNVDGTNACDVTIEVSNDNGSTYYKIGSTISVPADSTLSFLSLINLEKIIVVEEKRSLIETQVKEILFNTNNNTKIVGKLDEQNNDLFLSSGSLDPGEIAIKLYQHCLLYTSPSPRDS